MKRVFRILVANSVYVVSVAILWYHRFLLSQSSNHIGFYRYNNKDSSFVHFVTDCSHRCRFNYNPTIISIIGVAGLSAKFLHERILRQEAATSRNRPFATSRLDFLQLSRHLEGVRAGIFNSLIILKGPAMLVEIFLGLRCSVKVVSRSQAVRYNSFTTRAHNV